MWDLQGCCENRSGYLKTEQRRVVLGWKAFKSVRLRRNSAKPTRFESRCYCLRASALKCGFTDKVEVMVKPTQNCIEVLLRNLWFQPIVDRSKARKTKSRSVIPRLSFINQNIWSDNRISLELWDASSYYFNDLTGFFANLSFVEFSEVF